jgi:hypothetical protein
MPFFEYFALEPLANRILLDSGPGAVPLDNASRAHSAVDNALDSAATGTDGLMKTMAEAWPGGLSSQRAQSAFGKHNQWVREQAANSGKIAQLADQGAGMHNDALGSMPARTEIEAVMAELEASAGAVSASVGAITSPILPVAAAGALALGPAMAWHAKAEAHYQILRIRAATTMMRYEKGAVGLLLDLVATAAALTPPPPIVVPGPGSVPTPPLDAVGPLNNLITNGPDSPHYPGNGSITEQGTGSGPESAGDSNPGGEGTDPGTGGEGPDPGPSGSDQQPLADTQQPGFDSGADGYGADSANSSPLLGVSSESSTLGALNGGAGVLTGLGMVRGGIGSMPGAATGFRLPGGWNPAAGTAFGAPSTAVGPSAPARNVAKRVSAPTAQMRRRRQDEETRKGKVFTPGEQFEVPELERPPVIGVIEYQDDELDTDLLADSSLVGVLDRLDEEPEPDNGYSTR